LPVIDPQGFLVFHTSTYGSAAKCYKETESQQRQRLSAPRLIHGNAVSYDGVADTWIIQEPNAMSQSATDRNLLFGILALQMDFITRDGLIAAMNGWVLNKDKSLSRILVEQGGLAEEDRALLEPLVGKHLERHGVDAGRSLSALSPVGWIKHDLESVADSELTASLAHLVDSGPNTDHDRTGAVVGEGSRAGGPRYRVLRPHARGGLGEVYLARDEELNRDVALKQIQVEYADHPESRARFLMEAEVTGRLEHPGVVPVYGLGHFDDGRPFYAMRFIRGDSLKDAIVRFHGLEADPGGPGEQSLALRRLLGQFIDVCNAVAYAHSRGVLHRDLKPGNVMLGPYGETLVVDWGLAKTMDRPEGPAPGRDEPTLRPASGSGYEPTRMGSTLGTPAFMSPEQAEGRLDQLGPASDVYSLGATLYCLLTGRAPVDGPDQAAILDQVRNGRVPTPRSVKTEVPRALEAICRKAMALRPEDRYATPKALADDLEQWLADEPVSAYQEPWTTRLSRWTRRHKTAVAGTAAMAVTAMAALIAILVVVSIQKQETERQRLRAEANFRKAGDAVERLLTRVSEVRLSDVPQMESLRGELLEDALQFQLGFLSERSEDPMVLFDVARAERLAAKLQVQLNRPDEAETICRQGLQILDKLIASTPGDREIRRERAEALDTLGLALASLDRNDEAEPAYRQATAIWGLLIMEVPSSVEDRWRMAQCLNHLGDLLRRAGRWDEAEHFFLRDRQLCTASPADPRIRQELVASLNHLALVLLDRGDRAQALDTYAEAVKVQKALIAASPASSSARELLVSLLTNQANAFMANRQMAAAEASLVEADALVEKLSRDFPAIGRYQDQTATTLHNLANAVRMDPARINQALEIRKRALALQEALVASSPSVPEYLSNLGTICDGLASTLRTQHRLDEAEAPYRKALAAQARLAREHPDVVNYQFGHGQALHNLADLLREQNRPADALPLEQQAISVLESLYRSNLRNPDYRLAISYAYWGLCTIDLDRKDHRSAAEAVAAYQKIEPNGFEEAYESAGFLCRCVQLCRDDATLAAPQRESLARSYADRAMSALQAAVREGYRDVNQLESAPTFEPLRAREDFQRLVRDLKTMISTAGQAK
jgi:serine/threonine-protein kinase